jgi:hypothetical protein
MALIHPQGAEQSITHPIGKARRRQEAKWHDASTGKRIITRGSPRIKA